MDTIKIDKNDLFFPDGIVIIDRDNNIIAFNEAATRITGYKENDVLLHNYKCLFKKSEPEQPYFERALSNGESFSNLTLNITCRDNQTLDVFASISPITRSNNDIISIVFVFRDSNEMIKLSQSLQTKIQETLNEKNRFENIFHGISEGIFTIDNQWNIKSFNRSAEQITGYTREEVKGKKCWEIFNSSVCRNGCHMESTLKSKKEMRNNELVIKRKNGSSIPIRVNSKPFFNTDRECIGGIETFRDISEIKILTKHLEERYSFTNIIGKSKIMQSVYNLLEHVSQTDSSVLITGESGTGKELVARAIHLNSERQMQPFMAVNCSAFVETLLESELFGHERGSFTGAFKTKPGRFELAQKGTLLLDEIGDLTPQVQVKLLRVLETRQFERVGGTKPIKMEARIITATNKDLKKEIKENRFREDLYYRINVVNIHLPPLRERIDDLPMLVEHFINKFKKKFKKNIQNISPDTFDALRKYSWPGNIRELENVLEHTFVLCSQNTINLENLPDWLVESLEVKELLATEVINKESIKDAEKFHILAILDKYDGNRTKVAQALGIDKSTLWRKMKKYDLLDK